MSVPATARQLSPVENYTLQVIGDAHHEADLWSALPDHVKPERFKRNMVNLFMQKPEMLNYDPRAVFCEVSKAAALGLLLDPQLGEAYIVPVWNGKSGRREPELRCGYRGIMKLARQSDEIANLYPGEVRQNDHFIAEEGTAKRLEHRPDYTKPRGKPVCYYAVVHYKDGTSDHEVMDMESLHAIRDRSDGWKAFRAGKIKSTPWATDEGEMCKKTVLRRLLKRVPQSPELSEALGMENAADFAPSTPRLAPPPSRQLHAIEPLRTIEADDFSEEASVAEETLSQAQVAELLNLATEAGANIDKLCAWAGVTNFSEILVSQFARVHGALEAKLQQKRAAADTNPGAEPPSHAETPADALAGAPASPSQAPAGGDAGHPIEEPEAEKLSPEDEARRAGRKACRDGQMMEAIPQKIARYKALKAAWEEGYQAEGELMEAEMNQ
jgi:recombination protein RecT